MKKQNNTFYCFSPAVMLATFAIEIILFAYVLVRYRMNVIARLIAGALLLLAVFQFAEYHVCESIGVANFYSRLGYAAITMLPSVGIHIVTKIAGRESKKLVGAAYATGIMFVLAFTLSPTVFNSYECASNYAVFHLESSAARLYWLYYFGWLTAGIALCLKFRKGASRLKREALNMQAFGYLSFILPTGAVNLVNPATMDGIPSIMCGFAVIYALILAFGIAPRVLKQKPAREFSIR